jgi:hypothetical protein
MTTVCTLLLMVSACTHSACSTVWLTSTLARESFSM